MFTHFTVEPTVDYPQVYPGVWNNLSKELTNTIARFKEFNNTNVNSVAVDHILIKLITAINVPTYLNPERYYFLVLGSYRGPAEALGIGTDRATARPELNLSPHSKLYKNSELEIAIAYDDFILPNNAYRNWRNLTPIKILTHRSTSVAPKILDNAEYAERMPYIVYSINVPMLMLQFKGWYDNEMVNKKIGGSSKHIGNFIKMFPLTNAARTHVNLSLIECLYRHANNMPYIDTVTATQDKGNVGLGIMNSNTSLKAYTEKATVQLLKVPMSFNAIMHNCMTLDGSAWGAWLLPPIAPMGQVAWPLNLVALNYLRILIALSKANIRNANSDIISKIKREYRLLNTDVNWKNHLPPEILGGVMIEKDNIMRALY